MLILQPDGTVLEVDAVHCSAEVLGVVDVTEYPSVASVTIAEALDEETVEALKALAVDLHTLG